MDARREEADGPPALAVKALFDADLEPTQIIELTREDIIVDDNRNREDDASSPDWAVVYLANGAFVVLIPPEPITEYLWKATSVGVVTEPNDRLFVTPEGDPIPAAEFDRVQYRVRLAAVGEEEAYRNHIFHIINYL